MQKISSLSFLPKNRWFKSACLVNGVNLIRAAYRNSRLSLLRILNEDGLYILPSLMSRVTNLLFIFISSHRSDGEIYELNTLWPYRDGRSRKKCDRKSRNSLNSTRCSTRTLNGFNLFDSNNKKKFNCCYPTGSLVVCTNYNNFLAPPRNWREMKILFWWMKTSGIEAKCNCLIAKWRTAVERMNAHKGEKWNINLRMRSLCTFLAKESKYKTAAVHFIPHAITLSWKYFIFFVKL